jgi:hypothetical protein
MGDERASRPHHVLVTIAGPIERLDSDAGSSNTAGVVDPLVAALAQLVRERWVAERQARARLRVVEGTGHATAPRHD